MDEEIVIYDGREIPKKHFRTYIYSVNGESKLVNSWIEFECYLATGLWFSKKELVPEKMVVPFRKKERK